MKDLSNKIEPFTGKARNKNSLIVSSNIRVKPEKLAKNS